MVRYANSGDVDFLKSLDRHVSENELKNIISLNRILVALDADRLVGLLRFGMFWDNIPFMNLLYISEQHRRRGFGRELVEFWESEMLRAGFGRVLTSTQSDEQAQFFYRKLGYSECGALLLPGEPLEIIFLKNLRK